MVDELDRAEEMTQRTRDQAIKQARERAEKMDPGKPGDCDLCGEWSGRLVRGACARCRDKHHLP